jgi:hypothetical protein
MREWPDKIKGFLPVILVHLLILTASCGPVYKTVQLKPDDIGNIKTLAVVIPVDGEFTVVLDRATATATPAFMFGLIGAAVASSHNKSLDNEKVNALAPHLAGFSARTVFIESFRKALTESGQLKETQIFDRHLGGNEAGKYDAIVTLTIKDWGLRLPAQTEERLAGFIELEAKMSRTKDNQILWDEHDTILGQRRQYFSEYKDDGSMFRSEIEETVKTAGARAATKIAYPRGRIN